jgi:hypothetical protein
VKLTKEQEVVALEMACAGEPIKKIIEAILVSEHEFWLYKEHNPDFQSNFERARQEGLEHMADSLITIYDHEQDVQRARGKSDNFKWLLSKRKPQVYGDKIDINVNQTIDISGALNEARQRSLNASQIVTVQNIDNSVEAMPIKIDSDESVE